MLRVAMLIAILAFASTANAGLFDRFRIRSTPRATTVRVPVVQGKAAVKFRYECSNGTCRKIEVK